MTTLFTHQRAATSLAVDSPASLTTDRTFTNNAAQDQIIMLASPAMIVTRSFDIRRVHNSEKAMCLSVDVPNVRPDTIYVFIKHTGVPDTRPFVQVVGAAGTIVFNRKMELSAEGLDLDRVEACLSNGVLEITISKQQCTGCNTRTEKLVKEVKVRYG